MFNVPLLKGGVDARLSNTVGDVASAVEIVVLSYLEAFARSTTHMRESHHITYSNFIFFKIFLHIFIMYN